MFKEEYDESLAIVDLMIEASPNNLELLLMKADICFRSDRMFESEEIFLTILRLKPSHTHVFSIYLRLGLTYLNRKSWEDSKMVFTKAC